jgi:methylenetetrahydrofolate reductase (NADPH)
LTAELDLKPGVNSHTVLDQARVLASTVDALQVPDHSHARPHMSGLAVAGLLAQHDYDPVMHLNCRDRNRIALQSDLLGAQALGVGNLLLMRGRELPADHRPPATGVYDVGAIDLIGTAAAIRDGEALAGGQLPGFPEFFIGTIGTVFPPQSDWEPEKLTVKAATGAQFIQMQLCYDVDVLRRYMAHLVDARLLRSFYVMVSIAPLVSAESARWVIENMPDTLFPEGLVRRLEQAPDSEREGVAICAQILREVADIPGIAGANLVNLGDPALVVAAIEKSGLRREQEGM